MNLDGTKIATASKTGTLIRVFSVDGQKLHELRRGSDPCEIFRFFKKEKKKKKKKKKKEKEKKQFLSFLSFLKQYKL